jgi:hypothetical protein
MKTVTYKTIRDGVISRMGLDAGQPVMSSQAAALAEYLTTAIATAWKFYEWPDIYLAEERSTVGDGFLEGVYTYESDYVGTTSYIGRAVQGSLFSSPVWRIKRVTTTADGDLINIDTATDVAWAARLTATYVEDSGNENAADQIPYSLLLVPGANAIGEVLRVTDKNPSACKETPLLTEYCHTVADDRILITDTAFTGGPVWIEFVLRQPHFTSRAYDAAATYSPGDLVYHDATGDCYECLAATTGTLPTDEGYWLRQRIPHFLADYLKFYAVAETLAEDGQYDKSAYQFARAEGILGQRMDDAWLRKGEVRRYSAKFHH